MAVAIDGIHISPVTNKQCANLDGSLSGCMVQCCILILVSLMEIPIMIKDHSYRNAVSIAD